MNSIFQASVATLAALAASPIIPPAGAADAQKNVMSNSSQSAEVASSVASFFSAEQSLEWKARSAAKTMSKSLSSAIGANGAIDPSVSYLSSATQSLAAAGVTTSKVSTTTQTGQISVKAPGVATTDTAVTTVIKWKDGLNLPDSALTLNFHVTLKESSGSWNVSKAQIYDPDQAAEDSPQPAVKAGEGSPVRSSDTPGGASTSAKSQTFAGSAPARTGKTGYYNYNAMVYYAQHHSWDYKNGQQPPSGFDDYNRSYHKYPDDCTNFVSQALKAGGWKESSDVDITNYDNDHLWAHDVGVFFNYEDTYTWSSAKHLEITVA